MRIACIGDERRGAFLAKPEKVRQFKSRALQAGWLHVLGVHGERKIEQRDQGVLGFAGRYVLPLPSRPGDGDGAEPET